MNIFEKLPNNFFSILSSKNKNIYGIALVTLYDALTLYHNRIRKTDYLDLLKNRGEQDFTLFSYEDEAFDDEIIAEPSVSSKANFILRRLVDTGWVLIDQDVKTGAEYLLLPGYSISMLKILYEFIDNQQTKYTSYVHATYADLKYQDEIQDDFMYKTLQNAYFNTKDLEIEVAKLDHSIRVFHKQLTNIFSPNLVLRQHFDECREDVVDPIYHPLKTNDSIVLYNGPINFILKRWINTISVREKLIEQALKDNRSIKTAAEAEEDIIRKINYIQDTYSRLTREIEEIDKVQASYTKASTEKVIYLNNSDKSIKGKIETIFLNTAKVIAGEKDCYLNVIKDINNSVVFYQQGYFDEDCLQKPYRKSNRFDGEPLQLDDYAHEKDEGMMQSLLEMMDQYSDDRVMEFMAEAFKDRDKINVRDIDIKNVEQFIMTILATAKANSRKSFYEIKREKDIIESVQQNEFITPDYNYSRKEN